MFQEILIWIPCLCTILRNTEYLNQQKVTSGDCKSSRKTWLTNGLHHELACNVSNPSVQYLTKNNMEVNVPLFLNNAPRYCPKLPLSFTTEFHLVKFKFLPRKAALIQPVDQQVTANCKSLYNKVFHK